MKLLTIDPSVNNVGWAIFNTKGKDITKAWKFGTIKPSGYNLEMKIMDLIQQLEACTEGEFTWLCTERPAFFSSERGQIAARQNYTIDLAAINYFIAGWFRMSHRTHFAITATMWKGMVTKNITARRFFRRFPHIREGALSEHAIDAAMLGRFCVEQFISVLRPNLLDIKPEKLRLLI